jgi:hypothetical protein
MRKTRQFTIWDGKDLILYKYQSELYTLVVEQYIASLSKIFIGCGRSTFSRTITQFKECRYDNETCYDYLSVTRQ